MQLCIQGCLKAKEKHFKETVWDIYNQTIHNYFRLEEENAAG